MVSVHGRTLASTIAGRRRVLAAAAAGAVVFAAGRAWAADRNLAAARAQGITVPRDLFATANQVIE